MSLSLAGDGTVTGFDAGASGFGGLVAVKQVSKTDTFDASLAAGANIAVTGLSLTHAVTDAANKVLITVSIGLAGDNVRARPGFAVYDGTNFLNVGDAAGSRLRITAGHNVASGDDPRSVSFAFSFLHTPGTTSSVTYDVYVFNLQSTTQTLSVNRSPVADGDLSYIGRGASTILLQEVAV